MTTTSARISVDLRVIFVKLVEHRWFVIERLPITRESVNGRVAALSFP